MLTKKKILTTVLLVAGIIILLNFIADRFFLRLDFTADKRYSLSHATDNILNTLKEPVTVTAYFSEDLPPDIERIKTDFQDLLREYASESGNMVVFQFINPNKDQESEMDAQRAGIRPVMINVRERDQMKQQRAYLGAVVQLGEKKDVIPVIQPGSAMEFALSSSIKKISIDVKPQIGFLESEGEPAQSSLNQVMEALSILYNVNTVKLTDTSGVPDYIKTLIMVAPKDTIPANHLAYLDEFINRGGNLLLALNNVNGNLQNGQIEKVNTGMQDWLKKKGIDLQNNIVVDINCSNVMVRQQQGGFVFNTPMKFPYLPVITTFADHPITKGLESVVLPFASSIHYTNADSLLKITPIAFTSEKSGAEQVPTAFNVGKEWKRSDFPLSKLPVAVAVEGKTGGNKFKMVVFSDGDFAVNQQQGRSPQQQLQPDNVNLFVNSVDWLSDDTGLIELRTKEVTSRPLNADIEDSTKTIVKYVNFLLPILIIILYGFFRVQRKRNTRLRIMAERYD